MKNLKVISALCATAILCLSFAACSKNDSNNGESESFNFGHADIVTAATTAESTAAKTTTQKAEKTTKPTTTAKPTTTKPTTTKGPTTTKKQPTTAAVTTTAPTTTAATTQAATAAPTTAQPTTINVTTTVIADSSDKDFESDTLRLINEERKRQGLDTLSYSSELAKAAETRAKEQSDMGQLSHDRPDGSNWDTVSDKAMAENLAAGQASPQSTVTAWLNSSGHRKNMLNPDYKTAGVGCYYNSKTNVYYWVLLLGY